jgi:hypothetical protein
MRWPKRIVLCLGLLSSALAQSTNPPVTVPIKLFHNRVLIPSKINDTAVNLLLDSACTIPTLHPQIVEQLMLEPSGHVRIAGIAGEERAPTYSGVVIKMGDTQYAPRRIASIPSQKSESRRRRDGVVGSGFFRNFVVEMDARASTIRLYTPADFKYSGPGEVIPFHLREEIPVVEASIMVTNREPIKAEFEVDTGCDSGLCLGAKFVSENHLLESVKSDSSEKFGIGGSVATRNGAVPALRLGKLDVKEPQTDFFQEGSPVDEPMAGHIGMGVMHRYKVFVDYYRKQLILEPYSPNKD